MNEWMNEIDKKRRRIRRAFSQHIIFWIGFFVNACECALTSRIELVQNARAMQEGVPKWCGWQAGTRDGLSTYVVGIN